MAKEQVPDMLEDGSTAVAVTTEVKPQEEHWSVVMERAYEDGCSDVEAMKACKMTRKQFDQYYSEMPSFKEFVQRGRDKAEAWWLEQGRLAVKTKNNTFPQSLWFNCMQNKYSWNSKSDAKNANLEATLSIDKLKEEVRKALPDIHKMVNVIELDPTATRKAIRGE